MKCGYKWAGWRVLWHRCHFYPMPCPEPCPLEDKPVRFMDKPWAGGMTECPQCESLYVEWLNFREILAVVARTDEDVRREAEKT